MSGDPNRLIVRFDEPTRLLLEQESRESGLSLAEVVRRSVRSYVPGAAQVRQSRKRTLSVREVVNA